jgi:scyllo-inositol 2-dehydrogenase (NADP+)
MIPKSEILKRLPPIRLAIIGLVHDHVREFIPMLQAHPELELVGIVEPDVSLVVDFAAQFKLPTGLFFSTFEALAANREVGAVAVFSSTFAHRQLVEICAQLGIDVMMEKPLAVSLADAQAMSSAAADAGIQLIVNYETTWYPSIQAAYDLVREGLMLGKLRKIVIHAGHQGPRALGCSHPFLNWLTDPALNGGGAMMDFGCYGANLATWLMGGLRPSSVSTVTQSIQPGSYPKVEDEATIILTYPRCQAIIQASWNWPYSRKDLEIYGELGAIFVPSKETLHLRMGNAPSSALPVDPLPTPTGDPLSYLTAVVRRTIEPKGRSSLQTNMIVSEILDASIESGLSGRQISLSVDLPEKSQVSNPVRQRRATQG